MTPLLGFNPAVVIGTDIAHGAVFKSVCPAAPEDAERSGAAVGLDVRWVGANVVAAVWLAAWLAASYGEGVESAMGRVLGVALLFRAFGLLARNLPRSAGRE